MSPFVPLLAIYTLVTLGSASILYFSFKGRVDTSGKYFLIGELTMLPVLFQIITVNLNPQFSNHLILFLGNFFYISSEIAILFSIYTLTRDTRFNQFGVAIAIGAIFCFLVELCRAFIDSKLPFVLVPMSSIAFGLSTYTACKTSLNADLQSNLFLKWFRLLELSLASIGLLRVISYFLEAPISPRQAGTAAILVFTAHATLNIFRYIAYQSLRISWIDPRSKAANPLNQSLVKAVEEKNQLLEELITSNRAIGISALASSLAHQLSQPLTGINLQVEMLKRNASKPECLANSTALINEMGKELEGLSDLVKNLRLLFGNQHPELKPVQLTEICDSILEIIEPTLKANHILLQKIYKSQPVITGDTIQLQQVLINIFNNAIEAINYANPNIREIQFQISEENNFAILTIEDSGSGIIDDALERIFELYKTTKSNGIGVGLWLSRTIIQKHNGTINAKNGSRGACFEIRIPVSSLSKTEASS